METATILFHKLEATKPMFLGRNGCYEAIALEVTSFTEEGVVWLEPVTAKGFTARCRIEVPVRHVPDLIKVLDRIIKEG